MLDSKSISEWPGSSILAWRRHKLGYHPSHVMIPVNSSFKPQMMTSHLLFLYAAFAYTPEAGKSWPRHQQEQFDKQFITKTEPEVSCRPRNTVFQCFRKQPIVSARNLGEYFSKSIIGPLPQVRKQLRRHGWLRAPCLLCHSGFFPEEEISYVDMRHHYESEGQFTGSSSAWNLAKVSQ